jgi:hypothetical protein
MLGPPGDYTTGPTVHNMQTHVILEFPSGPRDGWMYLEVATERGIPVMYWKDDQGGIVVKFDTNGRAVAKGFAPGNRVDNGMLDWIRWRWRRTFQKEAHDE